MVLYEASEGIAHDPTRQQCYAVDMFEVPVPMDRAVSRLSAENISPVPAGGFVWQKRCVKCHEVCQECSALRPNCSVRLWALYFRAGCGAPREGTTGLTKRTAWLPPRVPFPVAWTVLRWRGVVFEAESDARSGLLTHLGCGAREWRSEGRSLEEQAAPVCAGQ